MDQNSDMGGVEGEEDKMLMGGDPIGGEGEGEDKDKGERPPTKLNICYLLGLFLTISIGSIQYGYMIGSWNASSGAYAKRDGWDEDTAYFNIMMVQSLTQGGSAVGALFSN